MGFNTVAVLYNDFNFAKEPDIGERIDRAMRGWSLRQRDNLAPWFGAGMVVSQAHADHTQIVVVGRNTGCPLHEAKDLEWPVLEQMRDCLEANGYRVTKRRKPKGTAVPSHDCLPEAK